MNNFLFLEQNIIYIKRIWFIPGSNHELTYQRIRVKAFTWTYSNDLKSQSILGQLSTKIPTPSGSGKQWAIGGLQLNIFQNHWDSKHRYKCCDTEVWNIKS